MIELNATDGFHIYGWMKTDLHLDGGDLIAFALVYAFIRSNAGTYKGNTAYLSAWTGWSERTSRTHLLRLTKMGLIKERRGRENNVPYCFYDLGPAMQKSTMKKFQGDPEKNDDSTLKKTTIAPGKNCRENRNIRIDNTNTTTFTPPTTAEVADYARARGFADPEGFADYYIETNTNLDWKRKDGKPVTNWKNNVVVWEKYHKNEVFPKRATSPTPLVFVPINDFISK